MTWCWLFTSADWGRRSMRTTFVCNDSHDEPSLCSLLLSGYVCSHLVVQDFHVVFTSLCCGVWFVCSSSKCRKSSGAFGLYIAAVHKRRSPAFMWFVTLSSLLLYLRWCKLTWEIRANLNELWHQYFDSNRRRGTKILLATSTPWSVFKLDFVIFSLVFTFLHLIPPFSQSSRQSVSFKMK